MDFLIFVKHRLLTVCTLSYAWITMTKFLDFFLLLRIFSFLYFLNQWQPGLDCFFPINLSQEKLEWPF